ncbi:MAG: hypothetical protein JOZ54_07865 [Acidobacteria bacterium]|nr:hypothetical protein [Acidobacteriota bacterium]
MFYVRLFFTLLFFGYGLYWAIGQKAKFDVGGSDSGTSRPIHVDAEGVDAVAIGVFAMGVGVINLAAGMTSRRRIPVFWAGVVVFGLPVLYAAVKAVMAIVGLFRQPS